MNKAITAAALASALLIGGTTTATGLYKDVQLDVDGQVSSAGSFALTVADVLAAKGISLAEGDLVEPAASTAISDGETVTVRYSKQVTLNIDGEPRTFTTTAATLSDALAFGAVATQVRLLATSPESDSLSDARMSMPLSTPLPRAGLTVDVSMPKQVSLKVAGKTEEVTTTAPTVADLLAEQGLTVGTTDKLAPGLGTPVADGQKIVLDRVTVKTQTKTEKVAFDTVQKKNSGLWKGESRVLTAGKNGKAKRTYRVTIVNGEVTKRDILTEKVLTKATDRVLEVGTKTSSNGVGINLARASMWDRIARCESGGNWHINTGNGYYGGLQFSLASWKSNGGRDFAAYPHQASRAEQITVANRYYAKAGTSPWTCA